MQEEHFCKMYVFVEQVITEIQYSNLKQLFGKLNDGHFTNVKTQLTRIIDKT